MLCNIDNIEIVTHYDLIKMINLKILTNQELTYDKQIIFINSIILKKYIQLNLINIINTERNIYYIACHIRMGDNCMIKNKTCQIQNTTVQRIYKMYNRLCGNKFCRLLIKINMILFIAVD